MPNRLVKFILMGAFLAFVLLGYTMPAAAASDPGSNIFDISEGNITVSAGSYPGYLKVTYGSSGTITSDIASPRGITITGSTTANVLVIAPNISDQVNITLNGASIDVSGNSACAFSIGSGSTVNLTLVNSNVLHSANFYAGLGVPSGANLNITAASTGELNAESSGNGAGIGGEDECSSGTITINGGTIIATVPYSSAGIGGGNYGSGTVIINGGTVTANCANEGTLGGGAGIGGGKGGSGTVTINSGTVMANSYSDVLLKEALAAAPEGILLINGAGIGGGQGGNGTVTITGGTVTASSYLGAGIGGGAGISGGQGGSGTVIITGGTIIANSFNEDITIGGGAGIGGGNYGSGTVTITGGTITANSGSVGAGIGGGSDRSGTVTIDGGTVTASGNVGAGIGGGQGGSGTVTISGGTVTANSLNGAGVGGGAGSVSGTVTVSGGTVTAATSSQYAEGIGKASTHFINSVYTVIISGGSVKTNTATVYYDNAATVRAYPVTVTLEGVSTVTDISYAVDGGTGAKCSTDSSGKIYLWLPVTDSVTMMAADTPENSFWQASGTIAAEGTNSFTAITSTSAVVILLAQPVDATIMPGQTATLAVTAAGSGTISYQWYSNTADSNSGGIIISGATNSSYTVTEQLLRYYYCVITSECNSQTYTVTSDTATVSSLLANISAQPSDIYAAKDGNATLSLTAAAGLGTLSYQWYSNTIGSNSGGDKIDGATASTYSAPTNTVGSVYYYCEVVATYEGYAGLIVSKAACVTVGLAITTASLPIGIIGTAYSKTLTAVGGITYTWSATGLPAGLSINSSTGVISGTPTDTGIFTVSVTVTNEKSETASAQFSLTINETFSIDLASLSVSSGSLSPSFDKNIVVYSVNTGTSALQSINITAATQDAAATLTINGRNAQSSVAQTVYLNQGSNLIPVVVTSPGGSSQKSYVVSVNGTTGNADLSSLTISGYTLNEAFAAGTTNYTLNVGNNINSLTIAAATSDARALMMYEGGILPNNTGKTINLKEGQNTLSIMVVAQDASTKTYSITVTREVTFSITTASLPIGIIGTAYSKTLSAQGGTTYTWSATGLPTGLSLNSSTGIISGTPTDTGIFTVSVTVTNEKSETASAQFSLTINETFSIDLASLSVSSGSLSPSFDKNIVVYSVDTGTSAVQSIGITAATQDSAATLAINGKNAQSSVAQTVYLNQGSNLIPVVVTSPGGSSQKSYIVSVNGTASNADLSSLTISGYTLNEAFAAGTTNYTLNVGNNTTCLTIAAATSDAKALMMHEGSILPNNTGKTINLKEGQNTLSIMVVAQDASTKTYTITVTREVTFSITTASLPIGIIGTAYSKTLSAQGGTTPYTWSAAGLPAGLSINSSTGVIGGTPTDTGIFTVSVTVAKENDETASAQYSLAIYETFSIDLASLSVSSGSLSPSFDKNIVVYSVDTSAVQSINITAATQDSAATLAINGQNAQSRVAQTVYLNQGSNLIPVVVASPDGSSQKSYVVSVNGTASNADLSDIFISVSGLDEYTLNEPFAAGTVNYTMNVGNNTTSLTIAAATSDAKALMILNGSIFNTSRTVDLAEGQNTVSIMVVAQDASTKTYTITITREATFNITTASLPIGIIGTAYSKTLLAQGGAAPYTWEAASLPAGLSIDSSTGIISGTPTTAGTYEVWLAVSDANSISINQSLTLKINRGCGAGAYLITPGTDSAYTAGLTDDGIPIMTVNEGKSGFTYFSAAVEPVTGHSGDEVAIFVHKRSNLQIGIMGYKGDFDDSANFQACFNVQAGDEIMIYIVDNLTNDLNINPTIL